MTAQESLVQRLRANYPMLVLATPEEVRAELAIVDAARETKRRLFAWSVTRGVAETNPSTGEHKDTAAGDVDPLAAARGITTRPQNSIIVLTDFEPYLKDPIILRTLRDAVLWCKQNMVTVIFLGPSYKFPPDLEREVSFVDLPLPQEAEIKTLLEATVSENRRVQGFKAPDDAQAIKAVEAAKGLTTTEIENAMLLSVVRHRAINAKTIAEEKAHAIKLSGALEIMEPPEGGLDAVGGLGGIKAWIQTRGRAFSPQARAYGLPMPKGLLTLGIPGTGKSLVGKAAAGALELPLLRCDVARVFAGIVGESEQNTKRVIDTIDAVAPCVVLFDEIEKAFAGSSAKQSHDSGVSSRVLGTFLTWLQDHTSPVFIIATSNDVTALPPELTRKGRWDSMMFVDLPTQEEREEILRIHLKKRGRKPEAFDCPALAGLSEGFSGAELEQAVIDAMFAGFSDNGREFATRDVRNAIGTSVPLSKTMAESVASLRAWAKTRCVPAAGQVAASKTVKLGRAAQG